MSDSSQLTGKSSARHLVVGTAGHIDHGKTSLVRALTGVDTDRLAEEKRRGISIDLGFAHLDLPDGTSLSFIDVPGHEAFIKNMLAGASGIRAVMLVVAADEGVKPQTREHLDICRLLNVRAGLVVLTKCDAADSEQIAYVREQVCELCRHSFLDGKPVLPVSAATGAGLDSLARELSTLAAETEQQAASGFARLPLDRSFALKGFGTVVTGTLTGGQLTVGDAVVLQPAGFECRIRGLQVHGRPADCAHAGERTAVNLSGIEHTQATRGMVLTHVNNLLPTSLLDASVQWLDDVAAPERRQQFLLYIGSAEIPVFLKTFDGGFARLWLSRPALVLPDDRFVLRRPSPAFTAAGGVVLDAFPPARLNRRKLAERSSRLADASWPERLELLVEESSTGRRVSDLVKRTGLTAEQTLAWVAQSSVLTYLESTSRVFTSQWLAETRRRVVAILEEFHRDHPALPGAPISQVRLQLEPAIARAVLEGYPPVCLSGDTVSLSAFRPRIPSEQVRVLARMETAFREAGYQPPPPSEVLRQIGLDPAKSRSLLDSLVKNRRLVRLSDDLVMHVDVVRHVQTSLAAHKGRRFSVPEFKEWTQISRKYAIPLLEYLDRQHIIRRDGDARVVL